RSRPPLRSSRHHRPRETARLGHRAQVDRQPRRPKHPDRRDPQRRPPHRDPRPRRRPEQSRRRNHRDQLPRRTRDGGTSLPESHGPQTSRLTRTEKTRENDDVKDVCARDEGLEDLVSGQAGVVFYGGVAVDDRHSLWGDLWGWWGEADEQD